MASDFDLHDIRCSHFCDIGVMLGRGLWQWSERKKCYKLVGQVGCAKGKSFDCSDDKKPCIHVLLCTE